MAQHQSPLKGIIENKTLNFDSALNNKIQLELSDVGAEMRKTQQEQNANTIIHCDSSLTILSVMSNEFK